MVNAAFCPAITVWLCGGISIAGGARGSGVTSAHEKPNRNSSHWIEAGTLEEPVAAFCRMLKRSMVKPSEPVVAPRKPAGAEAAPNVAASGLIHKEMGLGVAVKSYLPTRKKV